MNDPTGYREQRGGGGGGGQNKFKGVGGHEKVFPVTRWCMVHEHKN